jgi:hypothetical protein
MDPWGKEYARPTAQDLLSDPGYLARLDAQNRGLERGAAARGTLLTGGFQKRLGEYGQDYASNEYQNLANRSLAEYQTAFGNFTTDKARRSGEFQNQFANSLGAFGTNYDISRNNQLDAASIGAQNFGMGQTAKLNDFSIFANNRDYAANRDDTSWNRNRTSYNDQFDQARLLNRDWTSDNQWLGLYGRPAA